MSRCALTFFFLVVFIEFIGCDQILVCQIAIIPLLNLLSMTDTKGTHLFLGVISRMKNKNVMLTGSTDSCCSATTSNDNVKDSSVRSQSTAATDTSSIASNDDSFHVLESSGVVNSECDVAPGRTSAVLNCETNRTHGRRLRHDNVRSIQFNPSVQKRRHLPLHEYTTEELDACWFRGNEYAQIARSFRKEIKMLERGLLKNLALYDHDRKYCVRGLESHTRLAALARNQNRLTARAAVLEEQSEQLSIGVIDNEAIASRYRDASWSSMLWAIRVGKQDQREAELAYDSMLD